MSFFIICENWQVLHTVGYSHFVCVLCSFICARACVCECLFVSLIFFCLAVVCCWLFAWRRGGRVCVLWRMCIVLFCFSRRKGEEHFRAEESLQLFSLFFFHFQRRNKVVVVVVVFERCPVGSLIVGAHDDEWFGMNHFGSFVFVVVVIWCEWMFFFCLWMLSRRRGFSTKKKKCVCVCFFSLCIFFYYECSSFQIVSTMFLDSYCHQRNREKRFFLVCNSIVMFPNHWFCWLACHFFFVYVYFFFFNAKGEKLLAFY